MLAYTENNVTSRKREPDYDPSYNLPTKFGSSSQKYRYITNPTGTGNVNPNDFFNKKFAFRREQKFQNLPSTSTLFSCEKWKVRDLQYPKIELNNTKNKLNNYNLEEWHNHTNLTNHAAEVLRCLRFQVKPELLTQAWCKFYEIVSSYPLVSEQAKYEGVLNSVHLCEAPGAFITSLNHYLSLNHPDIQWQWLAGTLNPYHEQNSSSNMINDDRLVYNTLENWDFGLDGTGNIQNKDNMDHLISRCEDIFHDGVLLVTADGSLDCQLDPANQESLVSSLLYSEAITALKILREGGSFVMKIFTLFECETICLLYLLYCAFDSIQLFKPVTSKEGNSEVYLICLDYSPSDQLSKMLDMLNVHYGPTITAEKAMFNKDDIPEDFLQQFQEAAIIFKTYQEKVILSNIKRFQKMTNRDINSLKKLKREIAQLYIKRYRLQQQGRLVVGLLQLKNTPALNQEKRIQEGTFNDRLERLNFNKDEYLKYLQNSISHISWSLPVKAKNLSITLTDAMPKLQIRVGKPVNTVNSSKFCVGQLLHVYNELKKKCASSETKRQELKFEPKVNVSLCDVSDKQWSTSTWLAQKETTELIFDRLSKMESNGSLILLGLPLLTQYSVGLVYVVGHLFKQVSFETPAESGFSIYFNGLRKFRFSIVPTEEILSLVRQSNEIIAPLSLFSIVDLCGDSDFYSIVVATNHKHVKEYILKTIDQCQ